MNSVQRRIWHTYIKHELASKCLISWRLQTMSLDCEVTSDRCIFFNGSNFFQRILKIAFKQINLKYWRKHDSYWGNHWATSLSSISTLYHACMERASQLLYLRKCGERSKKRKQYAVIFLLLSLRLFWYSYFSEDLTYRSLFRPELLLLNVST